MSSPRVHQLLLTRFNIRTFGVGYSQDQSSDWLESRFDLFARYCAPSVAAQTEEDFDWIIFCDKDSSAETLARIQAFDPRIQLALFYHPQAMTSPTAGTETLEEAFDPQPDPASNVFSTQHVYPHVRPDANIVLSTRLDNDDALSRHAMRRVRDRVGQFIETGHDHWLYNPKFGYKLHHQTGRLFRYAKINGQFLTMFERNSEAVRPRGPYSGNHTNMHLQHPTYQDEGDPSWLMVVHDGNVRNRIRAGEAEVPLERLEADFNISI